MKPSEKTKSDLIRSLGEGEKVPESARPSLFKDCVERYFGFLPASTREAIFLAFEEKRRQEAARASEWLVIVAGIFLQDYDGDQLSDEEWRELRDFLSMDQGELSMDVLSYAIGLVLEHKAL